VLLPQMNFVANHLCSSPPPIHSVFETLTMPRLIMKAAILAAGVSSASAWASMVAQEGAMAGAPGMAPGPSPGGVAAADAPSPGVTAPYDPYAEPVFTSDEKFDVYNHHTFTPTMYEPVGGKTKQVEPSGDCKDYTWDENGVMSYGPVPCDDKPQFMDSGPTQAYVEHDGVIVAAVDPGPLLDAISDPHTKAKAKVLADAMIAGLPVPKVTMDFPADSADEACSGALAIFGNPDGVACDVVGPSDKRRALKSGSFKVDIIINPTVVDEAAMKGFEKVAHDSGIVFEMKMVDPVAELEKLDISPDVLAVFEDQVKHGEPMPMTTPPNVVGAPLTGCYELDSSPPEGYVHAESNLEFDVLRGEHEAVKFEVESEKFTSLTCSEAPTHHFQGSDYCKGTEKCDETCRMIMPPKCNTTEASFGVCAPTVSTVCDAMDNSKTACTLASQKVLGATVSYNHLDVQNSPCISSIHKVTTDAHEAYRVAYDEWVFAYNNASHACKVGTAIRDYNGMAFVQHHQNMDNIQKVSEMVCDDLDGFDFNKPHPKRRSLLAKNNETCLNIKQLIEEIKADTDLASRQIQCFASECMATKSLEAYKFQALDNKFFEYNSTLHSYKSSVETYNNAVADKYLKKAAAEESFDVFRPLKGDMTGKFHKDLEVYMSFASGAAEGNCGLTDCEMTAVCSFEMQYKFEDYVTKSERGCVRNDKPLVELCYSQEEEEARAAMA